MPGASRFPSTPRTESGSLEVARLAARQWGVVSRAQLRHSGLSEARIARWKADGRLHRVYRGIYAVGHRKLGSEGRLAAALLYCGPGAALSHGTAAWWWQLTRTRPERIHVSTPTRASSIPQISVHHPRELDRTWSRGMPITNVARTLLDIAPGMPFGQLRRALAEAEYRRLLDLGAVEAVLNRGKPGSAALRLALDRHLPRLAQTLSVLEERFLALCEAREIPLPEVNVKVCGLMVDALWREQRVIVELDGHAAHGSRTAMERDRQRELTLRAAGYVVLRYTWRQITHRPDQVAADLEMALAGMPAP